MQVAGHVWRRKNIAVRGQIVSGRTNFPHLLIVAFDVLRPVARCEN